MQTQTHHINNFVFVIRYLMKELKLHRVQIRRRHGVQITIDETDPLLTSLLEEGLILWGQVREWGVGRE